MLWLFKMVLNYALISLTKDALAMEWSILQWDYSVINIKNWGRPHGLGVI